MTILFPLSSQFEDEIFAANACSCACDPCTCSERCTCEGADAYLGSRWKVTGNHIRSGQFNGVSIAGRTILQLAVTKDEKSNDWQEVLLIDEQATPEQIEVLLKALQQRLSSQFTGSPVTSQVLPSVYLAPMHYLSVEQRPTLCVNASPEHLRCIREQKGPCVFTSWSYNGHVAPIGIHNN